MRALRCTAGVPSLHAQRSPCLCMACLSPRRGAGSHCKSVCCILATPPCCPLQEGLLRVLEKPTRQTEFHICLLPSPLPGVDSSKLRTPQAQHACTTPPQ